MKRVRNWLKRIFFPPAGVSRGMRILPYAILGLLTLIVFVLGGAGWEYTNSSQFCGTSCHTMPPEYTAYLTSPHAKVECVECHLGRGYIAQNFARKAGDVKHIIALAFKDYEYPIEAHEMRPARDSCERCHFPEKFSDDSLREIRHYGNDRDNTLETTYLILKTGGGAERLGLGKGIHWHIENNVFYLPADDAEQEIPYVRVVGSDGTIDEYIDLDADIETEQINPEELKKMDCITCHNRISHLVYPPEDMLDQLLDRGLVSVSIPEIRLKSIEMLYRPYDSVELALNGIAGLEGYYEEYYPEFTTKNRALIEQAIEALQDAFTKSVFPEQKSDWDAHPNNIGHEFSPGCFRCHDGKHLNEADESIRLECNLCHSIPVVSDVDDFVANIEISRGPEPETHLNANWISMHHEAFNYTCENCHTTEDPGGVGNTSFCSNSACHSNVWEYAGFDAPALRAIIIDQLPPPPPPKPEISAEGPLTYEATIGPLFALRCGACHGDNGIAGLNLMTYETTLAGGDGGAAILLGDPDNSLLILMQTGKQSHFGQLSVDELELVSAWIRAGAPQSGE